ncbi:hypothetical protein HPB52_007489 [Rhipicephalus sanguineus]|uniref:Exportin-4 n=1 Tax=Rhipicephalus sanguineus TaxID=34632 RepID=A0A9D4PL99_RHISA|nr:hypothetical protein HPB52_007489 [Rhipicephalus sanguineus]
MKKSDSTLALIDKVKILVVGDSGVGKSSAVHLLCHNRPLANASWTIGCNVEVKLHEYREGTASQKTYFVELWDIGGSSSHSSARAVFYNSFHGLILVHDLTNKKSHENLRKQPVKFARCELLGSKIVYSVQFCRMLEFDQEMFADSQVPILVVATKVDLVPQTAGRALATVADECGTDQVLLDNHNPKTLSPGSSNALKDAFVRVLDKSRRRCSLALEGQHAVSVVEANSGHTGFNMAAHVMQELESSAQILLAPPNQVTAEQRHAAERTFLDFQNTRAPFELCKCILETSAVGYVQFQAASLLKQGLIREWKYMEPGQWQALWQHLLQLLACRPNMENYVREELALVLALGSKRASVEDGADALNDILQQSTQMVASGEQHLQSLGCSLLSALLVEFSSSTRATDVGLTWEVHLRAKKSFEANHLRKVFQFCQQGLREAANRLGTGPVRPEDRNLLRRLLLLSEQLLSWNFQFSMLLPRKLVGLFEAQQTPTLRPGLDWKGAFDETPQLLLQLYGALSQDGELAHVALQCLLQLATLSHSGERQQRNTHLKRFIQGGLLELMAVRPPRAGVTQLLARLALFHPPSLLPANMHVPYLERLCDLACCVLQSPVGDDAEQQQETLDHILDAWVPLLQEPQTFPAEPLKVATMRVFELYLRSRLAAPDGTRPPISDEEEVAEEDEDDRLRYP